MSEKELYFYAISVLSENDPGYVPFDINGKIIDVPGMPFINRDDFLAAMSYWWEASQGLKNDSSN